MKLRHLTPEQRRQVAELAGLSEGYLRHQSKARRPVSALHAIRIERAAKHLGLDLRREQMCEACGKCDLARKAREEA